MPYVVTRQSPLIHQINFDDLICGNVKRSDYYVSNETNTRTRWYEQVPEEIDEQYDSLTLISVLKTFNDIHKNLHDADRHTQYRQYQIPKNSGGFRTISEPLADLKEAQRQLVAIFKSSFGALYHTSAFAYIENRCALDSVVRHQRNESDWYCAFDFHDFFGSTTKAFVMNMLSMIFPFSKIMAYDRGVEVLSNALDLCFLDDGLPQGAVSSPMITNLMMIPIDVYFANRLHLIPVGRKDPAKDADEEVRYIYTRYADDILISSRAAFDYKTLEKDMSDILKKYKAPFAFNAKKTHYGNRSGHNFHLGVIINKDNKIGIGWREQEAFKKLLNAYLFDRMHGRLWDYERLAHLNGVKAYYRKIDPDFIKRCNIKYGTKYHVDIEWLIKNDIKMALRS